MESIYDRTKLVLQDKLSLVCDKNILILGVGGVGGYCFEMLVRLGVKNITVVDDDTFKESNLNRQVLSSISVLGQNKVAVAKLRAKDINPDVKVNDINCRINPSNVDTIIQTDFDYVIDAIDDVTAKVAVIKYCLEKGIPLISSMGTGNRYCTPSYEVTDISKTSYDKLAKKIRTELKKQGIYKGVNVCYTKSSPVRTDGLGSIAYHPLSCAGTIVSFVVNSLIKND